MSVRTVFTQALSAFIARAVTRVGHSLGFSAWDRLRRTGRAAVAAGVGLAVLLAAGVTAQARISLSAPAGLSFVEVEDVSQLLARLKGAEAAGEPVMVYFAADWCASCSRIERRVFPDPLVVEALAAIRLVKVDVTDLDEGRAALMKELRVAGPPTMVFFGPSKREVEDTRLAGAIEARALVESALKAGAR